MPVQAGIASIDIRTGNVSYHLKSERVNAILPLLHKGTMLLGTTHGIVEWNGLDDFLSVINRFETIQTGRVTCLALDKASNIWVGTEEYGLFVIGTNNSITHIRKDNQLNSIYDNKINTICCDNTGIVWISVGTNGIDQLIPGNRFTHYSEDQGNGLNNNIVRCFMEDSHKRIWIATQGGGINLFDPLSKKFSSFTRKNVPGLPFDFIRFMVKDDKETAWIGTEKGMCRMDMSSVKTDKISFKGINNELLSDPYIEQIIPYENNSWLIATKEYGLFKLNRESVSASQLPFPGNKHVFYTALVNHLLFVSIWDDDPRVFNTSNGQWQEIKKPITSYTITYVIHDPTAKKYWIGTLKGLLETDEDLNILHHYTREEGLSNHYIYSMTMDEQRMLWISTNRGLSQFNTLTHTFRVFTPADGLQGYEYNAKASFQAGDGTLYFGGTNGFDVIKNTQAMVQPEAPRFYIKDLLINNVSYSGEQDVNHTPVIHLPYSMNNITIRTGIVDLSSSGNSKIRYKLEGSDADWKTTERDFGIDYSGLPPGDYTFVATAAVMDNQWSDQQTSLRFSIAKPWWQTLWFRVAVLLVLAILSIYLVRSYYHRKLEQQKRLFEKQQAVEHERTRIATDMHDDMGASLSRIKFLSETIGIKKQQQEPIEEDIIKIREYSHSMIDKMGEIVWALNEKNDSLNDLLSYTRAYAVEYLTQNNIHCTVEAQEQSGSIFVSGEFRRNIYLTVKEALHNIVKHSQATHAWIDITAGDDLFIRIRDNGIGFDETKIRAFSNGFNNMKKRMESLRGKWEIKREKETIVTISAPLYG
jgi:signal transduction histidine kinase/ligand-binding sensor domain-containing protein